MGAVHGNQQAMDGFVRMNAGTISPAEFFAPENVDAIAAAAGARRRRIAVDNKAALGSCRRLNLRLSCSLLLHMLCMPCA